MNEQKIAKCAFKEIPFKIVVYLIQLHSCIYCTLSNFAKLFVNSIQNQFIYSTQTLKILVGFVETSTSNTQF